MDGKEILSLTSEALFRYLIVQNVLSLQMRDSHIDAAVRTVADESHLQFNGTYRTIDKRTIYRWLADFKANGLEGLAPQARDSPAASVISQELLNFVASTKKLDPKTSLPEIIRRAKELGLIHPMQHVDRTTLWRTCRKRKINTERRLKTAETDMRRFAYPERMMMVLADFKHFRVGASRLKRVALYLLDDSTRYGIDVFVGTSENSVVLLHGLARVIRHVGIMDALFWDHGSAFICHDVACVAAAFGICVIFGRKGYPEGHGKIERFNQSVNERLLRTLNGSPEISPACTSLTTRLRHDLEIYNRLPHESLNMDSPEQRWLASQRPLRPAPSEDHLRAAFTVSFSCKVSKDQVIKFKGVPYEMPRGYAKQKVTIYRRLLEGDSIYFSHKNTLIKLNPVDTTFNAYRPRMPSPLPENPPPSVLPKSSSTLHFENAFKPMIGPDGGYDDVEQTKE